MHDDVIKWKHFPRYWPFVRGIHRSPVNSPHKDQWRGALIFSLIWDWIIDWVNNREAGDLRRHRPHYNVTVMARIQMKTHIRKCQLPRINLHRSSRSTWFNTLRPRWNEQHFADDIFKLIFFNGNVWISIKISLKFVPNGPIKNILALVQIMAWRRSGDKPLSEPIMVSLSPRHTGRWPWRPR